MLDANKTYTIDEVAYPFRLVKSDAFKSVRTALVNDETHTLTRDHTEYPKTLRARHLQQLVTPVSVTRNGTAVDLTVTVNITVDMPIDLPAADAADILARATTIVNTAGEVEYFLALES